MKVSGLAVIVDKVEQCRLYSKDTDYEGETNALHSCMHPFHGEEKNYQKKWEQVNLIIMPRDKYGKFKKRRKKE